MTKIKIALAGVGNCSSGFVQGLHYYKDMDNEEYVIGLRRLILAGYHPRDIEIVAAFDVDARKVGKDLSKAIFAEPNNTLKFAQVPELGVSVQKGQVLDGLGSYLKDISNHPALVQSISGYFTHPDTVFETRDSYPLSSHIKVTTYSPGMRYGSLLPNLKNVLMILTPSLIMIWC